MEDIAREAELAKATLYLYSKTKDNIHLAIAIRSSRIFNPILKEYSSEKKTGIEKLKSLTLAFYEFYKKYLCHDMASPYSQIPGRYGFS